jgi:hypothetical protein
MTEIKNAAQQNNDGSLKHINILKGGNFKDSPFYHSFGSFLKNENSLFTSGLKVCPKNPKVWYNLAKMAADRASLPHLRLDFAERERSKGNILHYLEGLGSKLIPFLSKFGPNLG